MSKQHQRPPPPPGYVDTCMTGRQLKDRGIPKPTGCLYATDLVVSWMRSSHAVWYYRLYYAVPIDSKAADKLRLMGLLPEKEESSMNKPYTIHRDGSVSYKGHTISADEIASLLLWYSRIGAPGPRILYHSTCIGTIKVGCQEIPTTLLSTFVHEYREGKWKQPEEPTFKAGQRFIRKSRGDEWLLTRVGNNAANTRYILVNLRSGISWFSDTKVENQNAIKLREIAGEASVSNFEPIES